MLFRSYRDKKKDFHMVFIDLEKAYNKLPRDLIWWALEKKGVIDKYIEIIKHMHNGAMTTMRTVVGKSNDFPITIGLHQGSVLSPYLFALVMDELTKHM